MEVTALAAVQNAKASFGSSQNISIKKQSEIELGSLNVNQKRTFITQIAFPKDGHAVLKGIFTAIDKNGNKLGASDEIYFLVKKGETFYGRGDFMNARIDSLKYKLKTQKLAPEVYKQSFDKAIKDIIKGKEVHSGMRRPVVPKSPGQAVKKAAAPVTVSGIINWTAPNGDKLPLKLAVVQIWDEDILSPELLATTATDINGFYTASVSGSIIDNPDIYVRVLAKSDDFFIVPDSVGGDESKTHFYDSAVFPDVTAPTLSIPIDIPSNKTDDLSANVNAFCVHAALIESADYVKTRASALPKLTVIFPVAGNVSNYSGTLNITRKRRFAWDVIHHEYGHYVAKSLTLEGVSPGGNHGPGQNLAETRTKEKGMILAWSEGWPTYFGTSLQQVRALNIPSVGAGDILYDNLDPDPALRLTWSLKSQSPYPSIGEDNEVAVQRVLWDLYDNAASSPYDEVTLGDVVVWQTIANQHPKFLYDIWTPFTTGKPMSEIVKYGAIFAEHKVASLPKLPASETTLPNLDNPVTFEWDANGAGPSYKNNKFTVEFYNPAFSKLLFTSPEQSTPKYIAKPCNLQEIFADGTEVKWVVKSSNKSASPTVDTPDTGPYTSPAFTLKSAVPGKRDKADIVFVVDDTGSMGEEIEGVKQGIISYLDSFSTSPDSASCKVFQLVTFKDDYTIRPASTDLNVIKNQVSALFASGGSDCPEASIEALIAVDALVKDGGDVRLYTDADPHAGLNPQTVIDLYSAHGVTQSTLLSGTCSGSFVAASDGTGKNFPPSDNKDGASKPNDTVPSVSAIDIYSFMAQQTGGDFVFFPEVNSGDPSDFERYSNLVLNILVGTVSSAVTLIEPYSGPAGSSLTLTITGRNTNFNDSSAISFSGEGITTGAPNVISATKMEVPVTIDSAAALGFRDITITSTLDSSVTETANGIGLFSVTDATGTPTIVGITPPSGTTGQTLTVTISGQNTTFTDSSVLNMEAGITVLSRTAINQAQLQAQIKIADDATPGFRNVTVTTGTEVATENVTGPFLVTTAGCTPISIESVTIPSGSMATLTATGCLGTLLWSTGDSTSTITIGPLTEGTTVSATCKTGECEVSASATITVTPSDSVFALAAPDYNCSTGAFTFNTTGGDGTPVTFSAIGITGATTNPNQFVDTELRTAADAPLIALHATQSGVSVSYLWSLRETCPLTPGDSTFRLIAPTYNCSTGAFKFNTAGGNSSTIEYRAVPGITDWTTNPDQFVDFEARTSDDVPPFYLQARQNGVVVALSWDLKAACGRARMSVFEPEAAKKKAIQNSLPMRVSVLGNPVAGENIEIEVRGAEQQPLKIQLSNIGGQLLNEYQIKKASGVERLRLPMTQSAGMYLLQISSPGQKKVLRVLKVK